MPAQADFSSEDAVAAIERATSFTEPLRRRSEGVTIALWGFVTACVVLTNGVADDVYGFYDAGGAKRIVSSLLWLPWAALGVLSTIAVWRIAEVSARTEVPGRRRSLRTLLAWLVALLALLILVAVVAPVATAGFAVAAIGFIWLATGVLDLYRATPEGRRTLLAVGGLIVAVGVAFAFAARGAPHDGWDTFELVAVPAGGLVPIVAGLLQALRG